MLRRNGAVVGRLSNIVGSYIERARQEIQEAHAPKKKRKVGKYKSQEKLTVILESIFGCTAETEKTFPWLISPRGAHLRVDIYFEKLNLAVEYHGKQHSEFPNAFHKTAEDFRYAAMCDAWKISSLRQRGINVVEFGYKEKLTKSAVTAKLKRMKIIV